MDLGDLTERFAALGEKEQQLAIHLLPWAHKHAPEKYEALIRVAMNKPGDLTRVLHRLFEVAWRDDRAFAVSLPLSVFEHSTIVAKFKQRSTGKVFEFKGALCDGARCWGFAQLDVDAETFASMVTVQESDLGPLDYEAGHHKMTVLALLPNEATPFPDADTSGSFELDL